ncbi:unnamed protein product [Rotaria sp. Silwood2]|nr:unnamed protein product [Rotaria sp. Silwood2]CAF4033458.1 unnamed protein product [Rotaria sp. Silwood2]
MIYQPDDIFHHTYDDNEFNGLETSVSLPPISQVANNEDSNGIDQNLLEPLNELSASIIVDEFINKIISSGEASPRTLCCDPDEPLFPGYQLEDNQLEDFFEDPINEVTTTTTTIATENANNNNIVNDTSSELISKEHENFKSDDIKNVLNESFAEFSLQMIDNSIEQRTMVVESQPPANLRYRYGSDGKRQIEKSRTKPMIIKLPDLKDIQLNSNQSFWFRLILTTYSKNPLDEEYLHVNKLEYHCNDVHEFSDKTICIPLTPMDIKEGKKVLPRLSIIKTTLNNYKSKLVPLSLTKIHNEPNENINERIAVREAKKLFKKFNLKASRIVCELVIKQNELWHFTNITCETNVIENKDQKITRKKRSAKTIDSDEEELSNERPNSSKSKSTKRKKHFN